MSVPLSLKNGAKIRIFTTCGARHGGIEASLRRFAHYDYWKEDVLPSIVEDSGADIVSFGMGEHQTVEIARRLAAGEPVESITDVNGTCYLTDFDHLPQRYVECAGFKKVAADKTAYAKACRIQMDNQDVVSGQIIVQKQSEKYLVQNIPPTKVFLLYLGLNSSATDTFSSSFLSSCFPPCDS